MLQDGEQGVIIQRDGKTYAIAPHVPCGVITPAQLRAVADAAERYGAAAVKLTSAARFAIVGLKEEDIDGAWRDLDMKPGAGVGLCVRSVKACPGATFCRFGMQDSLTMGLALDTRYHGMALPSKFKFGVSGCPNQCAETCIKDVGLVGAKSGWRMLVGGNGGVKPRLSRELARDLGDEDALALIDRVIGYYRENARDRQRLGALLEKVDFDDFKKQMSG